MTLQKIQHIIQEYQRGIIDFDSTAMELFSFQYTHNPVYKQFCDLLNKSPRQINRVEDIPYLPIEFFKTHKIKTGDWREEKVYTSSGTTGSIKSKHVIFDEKAYLANAQSIFEKRFGAIENSIVIGLLPSYLESNQSSLVAMVDHFIHLSGNDLSGFYLYDHDALFKLIEERHGEHTIFLFGVSYALLDYVARFNHKALDKLVLLETGGMKGRRAELTKQEMYSQLKTGFPIKQIDSEYGMTELLSQAYTQEESWFKPNHMLKVSIAELNDPYQPAKLGKSGLIRIIDLMNYHSCSFIATQDLGKIRPDGCFQVLGRIDHSDIRGCNLLVQ